MSQEDRVDIGNAMISDLNNEVHRRGKKRTKWSWKF